MPPQDKPFTPASAPSKDFDAPTAPTTAFTQPPAPSIDPEAGFPHPFGRYQLQPDQSVAMGLEVQQFLNRQVLLYKQAGEDLLVYRQKKFGELCACVDPVRNQPQDGCAVCYGTRFVGGYTSMGRTLGYVGPNPLTRTLTQLGIVLSQKPSLWMLPDPPILDRDFIVAKGRYPAVDLMRVQEEPVVRGAGDRDFLSRVDVTRVLKIAAQIGGPEGFVENKDFVLTGGELVVSDALTAPPNADSRVLRVEGKRWPLFPPAGETPTGDTIDNPVTVTESGLQIGQQVTVVNQRAGLAATGALAAGAGPDASFLVVTVQGSAGSGISSAANLPVDEFLATVRGDALLWLTTGIKPTTASTYYVTYEAALDVTKRYQILNVTLHEYQGVPLVQQAEIQLMEQTHPIYGVLTVLNNGTPADRQDLAQRQMRAALGPKAGLESSSPNVSDPRFLNPGDFGL